MPNPRIALIRFEIFVNGERVAITGLDTFGVLSAHLSLVVRDPAKRANAENDGRLPNTCYFEYGGLDSASDTDLSWGREALRPGDEVTTRILPAGEYDAPQSDA